MEGHKSSHSSSLRRSSGYQAHIWPQPFVVGGREKREAEQLLFQIYSENSHDANDLLYCLPTNVYSKSKVNVGKMRLFPLGTLTKIKDGKKAAILI